MFGKFLMDGKEYSYFIPYSGDNIEKAEEYYKEYEADIISRKWKMMGIREYKALYNYGILDFMDSYWLEGYVYYGRNGVSWLGYQQDKKQHKKILIEIL